MKKAKEKQDLRKWVLLRQAEKGSRTALSKKEQAIKKLTKLSGVDADQLMELIQDDQVDESTLDQILSTDSLTDERVNEIVYSAINSPPDIEELKEWIDGLFKRNGWKENDFYRVVQNFSTIDEEQTTQRLGFIYDLLLGFSRSGQAPDGLRLLQDAAVRHAQKLNVHTQDKLVDAINKAQLVHLGLLLEIIHTNQITKDVAEVYCQMLQPDRSRAVLLDISGGLLEKDKEIGRANEIGAVKQNILDRLAKEGNEEFCQAVKTFDSGGEEEIIRKLSRIYALLLEMKAEKIYDGFKLVQDEAIKCLRPSNSDLELAIRQSEPNKLALLLELIETGKEMTEGAIGVVCKLLKPQEEISPRGSPASFLAFRENVIS